MAKDDTNECDEFINNYKISKANIKIPSIWSVNVGDYHEFEYIKFCFQNAGIKCNYEEVGCNGIYHAIFWIGKKPIKYIKAVKTFYGDLE